MPSNKVAIALIFFGLVPLGMSMQAIFFSGSEVTTFPLKGHEGHTGFTTLQPDMNPIRLLITLEYGSKAFSTVQRYIEYSVTAKAQSGDPLWEEDGRASITSDKKVISDQSHHSSLQTFDIDAPTDVQFDYKIEEENLRFKGGYLTLKRNVTPHNWLLTIIGLVILVTSILIFASNQKR